MTPTDNNPTSNINLWEQLVINQQQVIELQRTQLAFQQSVTKDLAAIKDILSQAKGGWRVLLIVGGCVGTVAAAVAWVWLNFFHHRI